MEYRFFVTSYRENLSQKLMHMVCSHNFHVTSHFSCKSGTAAKSFSQTGNGRGRKWDDRIKKSGIRYLDLGGRGKIKGTWLFFEITL